MFSSSTGTPVVTRVQTLPAEAPHKLGDDAPRGPVQMPKVDRQKALRWALRWAASRVVLPLMTIKLIHSKHLP